MAVSSDLREFCNGGNLDFFNRIGPKQTWLCVTLMSAFGGRADFRLDGERLQKPHFRPRMCIANGCPVAECLAYRLTDYCKFDMLQSGLARAQVRTCRESIFTRIFNVSIS